MENSKTSTPRIRRSSEQSRDHILQIAEKKFDSDGLEGLKLTDIAKDAGISHGTILHHFGTRDGLHNALMQRLVTRLVTGIIDKIRENSGKGGPHDRSRSLHSLYATLARPQHAALIHWLVSGSGSDNRIGALSDRLRPLFEQLAEEMVATSTAGAQNNLNTADVEAALRDVRFYILLAATAAIGDGLAGDVIGPALGIDRQSTRSDFLAWLASLAPTHN